MLRPMHFEFFLSFSYYSLAKVNYVKYISIKLIFLSSLQLDQIHWENKVCEEEEEEACILKEINC